MSLMLLPVCLSLAMAKMIRLSHKYILKYTEREGIAPAEPCGIVGWGEIGFDGQIYQIMGSFMEGMSLEELVDF